VGDIGNELRNVFFWFRVEETERRLVAERVATDRLIRSVLSEVPEFNSAARKR